MTYTSGLPDNRTLGKQMKSQSHTIDAIQKYGRIKRKPEIRVWIHPGDGDDYYQTFHSIKDAKHFIKNYKGSGYAEKHPNVAYLGKEIIYK